MGRLGGGELGSWGEYSFDFSLSPHLPIPPSLIYGVGTGVEGAVGVADSAALLLISSLY